MYIVVLIVVAVVLALIRPFLLLLWRQHISPLKNVAGPASHSFFMGNLKEMHDMENTSLVKDWQSDYGSSFVYRGFVGGCRLMTTDPVAVAHILAHPYDYPKPDFVRDSLATMAAGHVGLLTSEGDMHRKQRKILTPAFSNSQISLLTPIFHEKARHLVQLLPAKFDALSWLSRATLDVIGLAGFGYMFNALEEDDNELATAFSVIFSTARKFRVMTILQVWFPFLRKFRRNSATMVEAQATMKRIGLELIEQRTLTEKSGLGDGGRDLLSVLIRSNLASAPNQQMSIPEILCQISTFIAAGHETTSSALTWTLYALAKSPQAQATLRAALRQIDPSGTMSESELSHTLKSHPYLDAVIRESLRLHAPVSSTMRECTVPTDSIPLSSPLTLKDGSRVASIPVKQHDIISIPISAINKSTALWGDDAELFKPERWLDASLPLGLNPAPHKSSAIQGLYAHTLTFLNSKGARSCIGYQFALMEMKIFLYYLVKDREYRLDLADGEDVEKKVNVVTRPFVKSQPEKGNQMPLVVRPVP